MMSKISIWLLSSILLFQACVPVAQQGGSSASNNEYYNAKNLVYDDKTYEDNIKSVQLYQYTGNIDQYLSIPVIPVSGFNLVLEFDELNAPYNPYWVKIISCNSDWTDSQLPEIMYLNEYNMYQITSYENSSATKVPYTHYKFQVPRVKISGNFLIKVFRGSDESDLIITRRFMVYENTFNLNMKVDFSSAPQNRYTHQEVSFNILYGNADIQNFNQQLKVVVRQNNRWDNAVYNLQPTFIKEYDRRLDYVFYNLETNFQGGNEFRIFNTQNFRFMAQNLNDVKFNPGINETNLVLEKSRNESTYTLWNDINGKFLINRQDAANPGIEADYSNVHFYLQSELLPGRVYIFGALTDWKLDKRFQMAYNPNQKYYEASCMLKQGIYNYAYVYVNDKNEVDEKMFEGSYHATENQYDILVYFRPIGGRSDLLVAYKSINFMSR